MARPTALVVMVCSAGWSASCSHSDRRRDVAPDRPQLPSQRPIDTLAGPEEPESTPGGTLETACAEFATRLVEALPDRQVRVAVLPLADSTGGVAAGSHFLADQLAAALLSRSLLVADRASLQAVLEEIDLASTYDNPLPALAIAPADVLVVGRYDLAAGVLTVDLKAVEVHSNRLLLVHPMRARPDQRLRRLTFSLPLSGPHEGDIEFRELGDRVRIAAAYTEVGAGQLRLLDRVRQKLRQGLAAYLRDALGCEFAPDEVEEIYRRGTEVDCQFGPQSVHLEMEFGAQPCSGDLDPH